MSNVTELNAGKFKVPWAMKVMYVGSLLIGFVGVFFDDDVSVVISVLSLIIISCAMSILEGIYKGFEQLERESK